MPRITAGGVSLNVLDQGSGSPLLLVHGFPLDHTMWQRQIDALSRTHRVIAPDLRGFGGSEVTEGTVTMAQFADDLAALLAALQVNEPIHYCGLSMGGYIGWQFWQRHKARVRSLVLCDTKAVADGAEAAANRRKLADKVVGEGSQIVAEGMLPKLFGKAMQAEQPQLIEATRQVMLRTDPQAVAAALRGMSERSDSTHLLSTINVPTLVIVGEEDAISTAEEMRGIANTIPGAQFVEVKSAGHMAPLEKPAVVNDALQKFLAR